ncbi:hypothetical protein [Glutamicibacter sp. MCAF14]|uniref:hypothetical protein n=1 Tax=Glutamicibacter sp. MCAF14 TaxID=3233043 RepID=UPI003F901ECE
MMNEINPKNQITELQSRQLAAFIHSIRPDWEVAGVHKALGYARGRGGVDALAVAAVRAAMVPGNRTPAVIGQSGAHWVGAHVERQGPAREVHCVEHDVPESRCKKFHQRVGPPDWWGDFRKGKAGPPIVQDGA